MDDAITFIEHKKWSSQSDDIFHEAVLEEDFAKVKVLLKYGGDSIRLNEKNKLGLSALQQSCFNGNLQLVMLLLDAGASMELKDENGWTALHFAVAADKCCVVRFLINSCADFTVMTDAGQLPIDLAKSDGMVLLLVNMMERAGYDQTAKLYRDKFGLELSLFDSDDDSFETDTEVEEINSNSSSEEPIYQKIVQRQSHEYFKTKEKF